MPKFKKGDAVRQIAPVITGEIAGVQYSDATEELEYLVNWTDGNGDEQSRWFTEADLEADA